MSRRLTSLSETVAALLLHSGPRLVLAAPLGLGKPHRLLSTNCPASPTPAPTNGKPTMSAATAMPFADVRKLLEVRREQWARLCRSNLLACATALLEPEWPEGHDRVWGGWGPERGRLLPGTAIFTATLG